MCAKIPPCFSIPIPEGDERERRAHLSRHARKESDCIELIRSSAACGSGLTSVAVGTLMHREQINQLTPYIDGSQIYGSYTALSSDLRHKVPRDFGLMRTTKITKEDYPPFNTLNRWPNDCHQDPRYSDFGCFLTGDVRANEQLALTSMHTLWLREHNRIANILSDLNPTWNGELIFQEARKIVGAELQHITYNHWLPHILGKQVKLYIYF